MASVLSASFCRLLYAIIKKYCFVFVFPYYCITSLQMRSLQILEKDLMSTLLCLVNCQAMTMLKFKLFSSRFCSCIDEIIIKGTRITLVTQILL